MNTLRVTVSAADRRKYIDTLLEMDGLSGIQEDAHAAYCPISLTQTPDDIKPYVKLRQDTLIGTVLRKAGITGYDPYTAPFSPDKNLSSLPNEIYQVDSGKIVGARYFVGHNITASTGFGVELEKASKFNRVSVILYDKHIRISRMQPHRTIYLQYDNFEKQAKEFVDVFRFLQEYEPGIGFDGDVPVLLGFRGDTVINLEKAVYDRFPKLVYQYDGLAPIIKTTVTNPTIFSEYN
jgi:hypothetical protein